jgi:hypothetical protein
VEGWLVGEPQEGDLAMGLDIVLHAASVAAAQTLSERLRVDALPIQSREEVLTELLAAPLHARPAVVHRARTLGMPIDGWHIAVRFEVDQLAYSGDGELAAYEARLRLARATLQALRTLGGEWHSARAGALVLVRMYPEDPGAAASSTVAKEVDAALVRVRSRLPATLIRCGVGSAYAGADGLRASSAEAGAAVAVARTSGRPNTAVPFDSVGLRRTLVEWYASDTAQDAVGTVLAPLTELGPVTGERLIQTLHVNRIFELLDVDRENPDDLLLLQLACRARELA